MKENNSNSTMKSTVSESDSTLVAWNNKRFQAFSNIYLQTPTFVIETMFCGNGKTFLLFQSGAERGKKKNGAPTMPSLERGTKKDKLDAKPIGGRNPQQRKTNWRRFGRGGTPIRQLESTTRQISWSGGRSADQRADQLIRRQNSWSVGRSADQ